MLNRTLGVELRLGISYLWLRYFVDVAEQCTVTVDEIAALAVTHRWFLFGVSRSEPFRKQRILLADESSTRRGINHSTNIEFHNITTATTNSSSSSSRR